MPLVHDAAAYVAAIRLHDLPSEVLERAKACLLYTLSMAVAGFDEHDATTRAATALAEGDGDAQLLVTGARRRAADAAFVNAAVACSRGQNDTHPRSIAHAGCVVVPAVLALAQAHGCAGATVLEALVAGYELLPKLAADAASDTVARGMRATSIFGPLIAAAACGRLLGLSAPTLAHAMAIATHFAGGTMQCWAEGTPEWRLQVAHSAQAGVQAALLARAGATGAAQALEGKAGFYNGLFGRVPEVTFAGWHLPEMVFKPYPGCLINQGAVHLVSRLMRRVGFSADDVEQVVVHMAPGDAQYPGVDQHGPFEQPTGAVMSLAFMLAVMLQGGTLRASDFRKLHGPGPVHDLGRRVHIVQVPSLDPWRCAVEVVLRDGRVLRDEMADQREFALGWDDTVALLHPIAAEWPLPDARQRIQDLQGAVATFESAGSADTLLSICCR